ncbi:MAG: LptE family protein [Sphingobacteriales bacterium]|nr:LptE family protein [Sphingobacteriales bacterium]
MMSKRVLLYTCLPILLLLWQSCGIYSFSGASVPPEVQTVSVLYFKNEASLVNARLSPLLTEKMQNKFVNETRLNLKDRGGDLEFSGAVVNYTVVPVALNSNERASLSRLTIEVRCTYLNRLSQETWTNSLHATKILKAPLPCAKWKTNSLKTSPNKLPMIFLIKPW